MKKIFITLIVLSLIFLPKLNTKAQSSNPFSNSKIMDAMGVQIHFTTGHINDLDMIQKAGFKKVRMDFFWNKCEVQKGVYDFSEYDILLSQLKKRGITPIFELDFGNPLYGESYSIRKPQTRKAFATFAAAAAAHYKNENIIWEIWNEPNISKFWYPEPNALEYTLLAKETSDAIRKVNPKSILVGPALSEIRYNYLEDCMKYGLLNYIDAITVHPYRKEEPESFGNDLNRLKELIKKYNKTGKNIQILSGEWGYPSATSGSNEIIQAKYLTRMLLYNAYMKIPISIWYDWRDDGIDPEEIEHNFGLTYFNGLPKPSYSAMLRLNEYLKDKTSVKRLPSNHNDYILLFSGSDGDTYVVWTTAENHTIKLKEMNIEVNGVPTFINY